MGVFMLVESILSVESFGALRASELRRFMALLMALEMLLSVKDLGTSRALEATHQQEE